MDVNCPAGFSQYNVDMQQRLHFYNSTSGNLPLDDKNSIGKNLKENKRKGIEGGGGMHSHSPNNGILKINGTGRNNDIKPENEDNCGAKGSKVHSMDDDAPKEDYIHVRAKRGQATKNHSLAERVRREKISERMRLLQDLVPGCNKIMGKAMMLDEIINYVQSLQRQVEFLSMKLTAITPELCFDLENILSKDVLHPRDGHPAFYNLYANLYRSSDQGVVQAEMMYTVPCPGGMQLPAIPQHPSMHQVPVIWDEENQNLFHTSFISNAASAENSVFQVL